MNQNLDINTSDVFDNNDDPLDRDASNRIFLLFAKLFYPVYVRFVEPRSEFVTDIEQKLIKADRNKPTEIYLSGRLGFGVVLGWFVSVFVSVFAVDWVLSDISIITLDPGLGAYIANIVSSVLIVVVLGGLLLAAFGAMGGTTALLLSQQSLKSTINSRQTEIDILLSDVVAFMYCQSVGGMNRIDIIREVAKAEETYGEVSVEFARIVHYMDVFNEDPHTAISRVAQTTPSDRLAEFLNDMLSTITSGGRMDGFLESQLDVFLAETEKAQQEELDTLEMAVTMYVTFSIIPVISLIIFGFAGGLGLVGLGLLLFDAYFVIPAIQLVAIGVAFIVFENEYGSGKLTPDTGDRFEYIQDESFNIRSAGVVERYKEDGKIFKQIYINELKSRLVSFLSNPIRFMYQDPRYTFIFSGGVASVFLVGAFLTGNISISQEMIVNESFKTTFIGVYIPFMILFAPYAIFYQLKQRKIGTITDNLTNDLSKLANTNERGITLRESILITSQDGTSKLADEFAEIYKKQEYGSPLAQAIIETNNKYQKPRLARTLRIIKSAQEISTNITEVLKTAVELSAAQDEIESERLNRTRQQVGIIAIIFVVFIATVVLMQELILQAISGTGALSESPLLPSTGNPIPKDIISVLFYHGALLHGALAGLLSGYIQTGDLSPGVKYSVVMVTVVMVVWGVIGFL
jgi:flagellar protein FlaJ